MSLSAIAKKLTRSEESIALALARRPGDDGSRRRLRVSQHFERHRQAWKQDEIQRLHLLAGKGMSVRAIAKALTRSEESVQIRARADKLTISKLR